MVGRVQQVIGIGRGRSRLEVARREVEDRLNGLDPEGYLFDRECWDAILDESPHIAHLAMDEWERRVSGGQHPPNPSASMIASLRRHAQDDSLRRRDEGQTRRDLEGFVYNVDSVLEKRCVAPLDETARKAIFREMDKDASKVVAILNKLLSNLDSVRNPSAFVITELRTPRPPSTPPPAKMRRVGTASEDRPMPSHEEPSLGEMIERLIMVVQGRYGELQPHARELLSQVSQSEQVDILKDLVQVCSSQQIRDVTGFVISKVAIIRNKSTGSGKGKGKTQQDVLHELYYSLVPSAKKALNRLGDHDADQLLQDLARKVDRGEVSNRSAFILAAATKILRAGGEHVQECTEAGYENGYGNGYSNGNENGDDWEDYWEEDAAEHYAEGDWRCPCGFKNKAQNTWCGGVGPMGCNAPRQGTLVPQRPAPRPRGTVKREVPARYSIRANDYKAEKIVPLPESQADQFWRAVGTLGIAKKSQDVLMRFFDASPQQAWEILRKAADDITIRNKTAFVIAEVARQELRRAEDAKFMNIKNNFVSDVFNEVEGGDAYDDRGEGSESRGEHSEDRRPGKMKIKPLSDIPAYDEWDDSDSRHMQSGGTEEAPMGAAVEDGAGEQGVEAAHGSAGGKSSSLAPDEGDEDDEGDVDEQTKEDPVDPINWQDLDLTSWLEAVDNGTGNFLQYRGKLMTEYDSIVQIVELYFDPETRRVNEDFFQDLEVTKVGHKRTFEKWFKDNIQ